MDPLQVEEKEKDAFRFLLSIYQYAKDDICFYSLLFVVDTHE